MKFKIFLIHYYRSIIVFLLILLASTIPINEVKKVVWISFPDFDKLVHLCMYFCFSIIMIFDISKARLDFANKKIYIISGFIALSYGAILEIIQLEFTRSRVGDIVDFLFNGIGALLAIAVWMVFKKSK